VNWSYACPNWPRSYEAADGVGAPDAVDQSLRGGGQHLVAGRVAVAVVDRLEPVEIDEDYGNGVRFTLGFDHGLAQSFHEQEPVSQASQRIVMRHVAYSGDGGQAFHLKADSDSGRWRTAFR